MFDANLDQKEFNEVFTALLTKYQRCDPKGLEDIPYKSFDEPQAQQIPNSKNLWIWYELPSERYSVCGMPITPSEQAMLSSAQVPWLSIKKYKNKDIPKIYYNQIAMDEKGLIYRDWHSWILIIIEKEITLCSLLRVAIQLCESVFCYILV